MNDSFTNSNSLYSSKKVVNPSRSYLNISSLNHSLGQNTMQSNSKSTTPIPLPYQSGSLNQVESSVIYGTNISTKQTIVGLESFIMDFQISHEVDGEIVQEKIYHTQLTELDILETNVFNVYGKHIKEFDTDMYYQFVYFPAEMISIFDDVVKALYQKLFITNQQDSLLLQTKNIKKNKLMTGIKGLSQSMSLREINHKFINKLISIKGIVIRCSQILPEMLSALFRCMNCHTQLFVVLENAKVSQPKICDRCRMKETLQIIHNLCDFTDKQFIKFQELPQFVPQGQTPSSMTLIAYDTNVDGLRPGDRVQIVGIYRTSQSKVQRNQRAIRTIFNTHLDMISYGIIEDNGLKIRDQTNMPMIYNDQDRNIFAKIADSQTVVQDLIQSFAPSIYGHDQVKKGLLTQLFGGTKKNFEAIGRGRFRSDINICLVGDPSTAKSQLLQQVHKISPRGIYTSGRGSSAVGLTAHVRRDPQTKQFVLESGALVLSDLGTCCIDQFDKMDPQSRLILLEAMQQQTISIAKAGIVCQLNSRTAILCAANPLNSRYNSKKSVVQNINLAPALLSRFDLIYILLDQPNQAFDRMLATHILNLYIDKNQNPQVQKYLYPKELLSKYITYAKQYVHPVLSQRAGDRLVEAYTEMRKLGNNKKVITATTRQLESLIRIAESFAKMRLSNVVQQPDVEEAIALVKFATQQAATDPTTGLIDMDVIVTGKTSSSRQRVNRIKQIAYEIIKANVGRYKKNSSLEQILPDIQKKLEVGDKTNQKQVLQALRVLQSEGIIAIYGQNKSRPNFKLAKDLHTM